RFPLLLVRIGDRLDLIALCVGQADVTAEPRQDAHRSPRPAEAARSIGSPRAAAAPELMLRVRVLSLCVHEAPREGAQGDEAGAESKSQSFDGCRHDAFLLVGPADRRTLQTLTGDSWRTGGWFMTKVWQELIGVRHRRQLALVVARPRE